ncbi:putative hydrolase [Minicystis rosea]|nr:putative hydrolase [Minicystis rosea]
MTIASPGPAEAAVLAELAPTFQVRHVDVLGGTLRVLEGGDGPPIVLVHGRGGAATSWGPLLPALARRGRVLAVDLPGFGASRGHRFDGGGVEAALDFFVAPLEAWLLSERIVAPAVVGHSLGGLVALEIALRRRVAPRALVPIAPMGTGPEVALAARLFFRAGPERLSRALGPSLFARITGASGPHDAALSYELHAVRGGRPDATLAFDTLLPLVGPAPHRRDRLASIDVPALVIGGDHDPVFPAPLAIAAAAALPRGAVHIEPSGHSPHADAPARVLTIVDAFLAAHS